RHRDRTLAASVCATKNDAVEQTVQQLPFLLDRQLRPDLDQATAQQLLADHALRPEASEQCPSIVESVLPRPDTLDELLLAENGKQLRVTDIEVELVLGILDCSGGLLDRLR